MVDVEEYLKQAGGNWLRAEHVQIGDKLEILDEGFIDDKTFDRPYLIFKVRLLRTGEEYQLRLGPKNVRRIADSFGSTNTAEWKGKKLEVISIEEYRGLGQRGILLRGVIESSGILSDKTIEFLQSQKDMIKMGAETGAILNESDFNIIPFAIRAELLKHGLVEKTEEGYKWTKKALAYL